MSEALFILKNHFLFGGDQVVNLFKIRADFAISFIAIGVLILIDFMEERFELFIRLNKLPRVQKWAMVAVFVCVLFVFAVWNETDFLYFQF